MSAPRSYRNFAEFEREEIRPDQKLGWCIDDLWKDADPELQGEVAEVKRRLAALGEEGKK